MRYKSLHSILFLMLFPFLALAQTGNNANTSNFYYDLGINDAKYELSLESINIEDERDFWLDQKAFENRLEKENPVGYQLYLNGKSQIYREHQIHCGARCGHSTEFTRYKAYYVGNGESTTTNAVVFSKKNILSKNNQ